MPFRSGQILGPYELVAPLGAGGMGEVWKARDTRLDRTVAVKFSQAEFSERFGLEARAVAALNHPHICTLYDVGPDYLVMEYVEGAPLRCPLPVDIAITYAVQILDALDAAHRKGFVHRDLKPANILVTRQGIKLLDFGLAKHAGPRSESDDTKTLGLTQQGQIVGTVHYMSPEQIQGKDVDTRSDLFAFGSVLYEMLSGRHAFDGESKAGIMAAVLERQPPALALPRALERILAKCLAKDPEARFQNASDLKTCLLWAMEPRAATRPRRYWWIAACLAIGGVAGGWLLARRGVVGGGNVGTARYAITPPSGMSYFNGKVSPDGNWLTFIALDSAGKSQLWVRRMASLTGQALAEGGFFPFWSPDSRFIAFHHNGQLKKISVSGGTAQRICDAPVEVGGTWRRDGTIIFGDGDGILRVAASGGEPRRLARLDGSREESALDFPSFLPDGKHYLYTVRSRKKENRGVFLGSLDAPESRIRLLEDMSSAEYTVVPGTDPNSGYLLFARGDALMAQPFDAGALRLRGEATPIVESIARNPSNLHASFSASQTGLLLVSGSQLVDRLTWFDRAGNRLGTIGLPGLHFAPLLAPNEKTLVVDQFDPERFFGDIWLLPTVPGTAIRLTSSGALHPVWSPDGSRIAMDGSNGALYFKAADGGPEETVLEGGELPSFSRVLCDWSKDGRYLLYQQSDPKTGSDLWLLPLTGDRRPVPFLRTASNEACGVFSWDSKWAAYTSDETGKSEVYVQALPVESERARQQVSDGGAIWPKWRRDGKELFYLAADGNIVAVQVSPGSGFHAGSRQPLFSSGVFTPDARFEVTGDGQRFIVPSTGIEGAGAPIIVVLNWTRGIR